MGKWMISVAHLMLLAFIFVTWFTMSLAEVAEKRLKTADLPPDKRGGVSILPGIVVFPLFFSGVAIIGDQIQPPWGTWVIAGFHALLGTFAIASIVYYSLRLRRKNNSNITH